VLITASLLAGALLIGATYMLSVRDTHAINTCDTGWHVGSSKTINCHGNCRVVGKSGGADFFVPTRSSPEWSEFLRNPPGNASIGSCGGGGGTTGTGWRCLCLQGEVDRSDCWTVWTCGSPPASCEQPCINQCGAFRIIPQIIQTACFSSCNNAGC
jgi:hypothetical protein